MAQQLDYVPVSPGRRRRRWLLAASVLVVIVASAFLAVPQVKAFQERQNRRAAIRQQFSTQIASAERFLDSKNVDDAALAILQAEFPTHTEGRLFWRSELGSFEQKVSQTRERMLKLSDQQAAEWEARRKAEEIQREIDAKNGKEVTRRIGCTFPGARSKTVEALVQRSSELLKAGNNTLALACCVQVVLLDPLHEFDKNFWTNVPK